MCHMKMERGMLGVERYKGLWLGHRGKESVKNKDV